MTMKHEMTEQVWLSGNTAVETEEWLREEEGAASNNSGGKDTEDKLKS